MIRTIRSVTMIALAAIACSQQERTSAAPAPTSTVDASPGGRSEPVAESPAPWTDVDAMLRALPDTLAHTKADGLDPLAARITAVPGVAKAVVEPLRPTLTVELAAELDAAQVVALLGWSDAHVISGDVHQRSWYVVVRDEDIPDPYGRRIATHVPSFGAWSLVVHVVERPPGPLPNISGGASPAYPLDRYAAKVLRVAIEPKRG